MTTHKNKSKQKSETHQLLNQRLEALNQFKIDLGLDRLRLVLDRLQLSQPAKQIITVGGTNGKGSTVAALCGLLRSKGLSFGAFTSPHIFTFNERININGEAASDDEILTAFTAIDEAKSEISLSYFEYAFLAALLVFISHRVDVIVLEVGLGGRLDATNSLDADVAIITTVDIDHTEWLGSDVETIAQEKAGIMRADTPVIYGDLNVPQAILTKASELNSRLLAIDEAYGCQINASDWSYQSGEQQFKQLNMPVAKGDWQIKNFSSALTAMLALGYQFHTKELQQVLAQWQIPGRLQTMHEQPLVLADVAHNKQAVSSLNQWLTAHPIAGETIAIFSVLADKEPENWLAELRGTFDHWLVFELNNARALELDDLKLMMADQVNLFSTFSSAKQAYNMALSLANPDDRIVVFGSFHVLEEVFSED